MAFFHGVNADANEKASDNGWKDPEQCCGCEAIGEHLIHELSQEANNCGVNGTEDDSTDHNRQVFDGDFNACDDKGQKGQSNEQCDHDGVKGYALRGEIRFFHKGIPPL